MFSQARRREMHTPSSQLLNPLAGRHRRPRPSSLTSLMLLVIISCCTSCLLTSQPAEGFHLSFGHRLLRSIAPPHEQQLQEQNLLNSPAQLNPPETLIRPIECRNAHNHSEAGICMFSIDCMQSKGVPLSICKHNYFVGTCCKLPDHNNFVGIVYDLRETENGQQLEARRSAAASSSSALHAFSVQQQQQHQQQQHQQQQQQQQQQLQQLQLQDATSSPSSPSSSSTPRQWTTAEAQAHTPSASSSSDELATLAAISPGHGAHSSTPAPAKLFDDASKYLISSTHLFSDTTQATSTTVAPKQAESSTAQQKVVGESARNADGTVAAQLSGAIGASEPAIQLVMSELPNASSVYELVSGGASAGAGAGRTEQRADEQTTSAGGDQQTVVVSSAHSASSSSATSVAHLVTSSSTTSQPALSGSSSSSSSSTTSDQEFTLSTGGPERAQTAESSAPPPSSSSSVVANEPEASSTSHGPTTATDGGDQSAESGSTLGVTQAEVKSSSLPSSPYVDLISSPETTTPFTSSLSTAILPSISSHPYAPTTLAPATSSPPPSSSASQQTLVTSASSSTSQPGGESTSQQPTQTTSSSTEKVASQHSSSQFVPQYYSTQSVGTSTSERPNSGVYWNLNSPSSLQAASSKIVTSNSGPNNLIPSLSGLQSAILAHIPFKIASGLSSGLSSYLQAAIKPPSHANRPLISSNTAPALQYQQQQQHHQNATSFQAKPGNGGNAGAPTAVRFPAAPATTMTTPSTTTTLPTSTTQAQQRDFVREAQLVCGRTQVPELAKANKRVARIVGGNQSAFGQWPWMVSLRQWRKGAFLHKCGAALLNENWAITAAHCVENVKAADLLLRLGEFDVSKQNEPYPYIERRVKTVVSHPAFDPKTFEYDLALLRFTEPIQFERNIVPVCVPHGNDSYVDRMATVIGWGRLYEDGPLPDVIQHVDVPIITNQECEKMYKNAGFVEEIPEMFICAGISKGGRDSCEGDSGGPLTMVDHDGRSYLVGIISWGIGCALPSQPGVYTRITAFSPWINQITSV